MDNEIKWKKNCPKCGCEQVYTSKYTLKNSIVKNTCCNKCLGTNKRIIIPDGGWKKLCPKCGREQIYSCKSTLTTSVKKNTLCNKCRANEKGIIKPDIKRNGINEKKTFELFGYTSNQLSFKSHKRVISTCIKCGKDREISFGAYKDKCHKCQIDELVILLKTNPNLIDRSFQKTKEYREMMSKILSKSEKNKNKFTEEFREKLRNAKLNQIKKLGTQYNYNPNACKFIEDFGKKSGYNFQHALNGGEVIVAGYSLDGYDKEKNVVFEYDEPKHNCISVKKNDQIRENRIIEKIKPKMFIRYNEEYDKLYDVISKKEIL